MIKQHKAPPYLVNEDSSSEDPTSIRYQYGLSDKEEGTLRMFKELKEIMEKTANKIQEDMREEMEKSYKYSLKYWISIPTFPRRTQLVDTKLHIEETALFLSQCT